MKLFTDLINDMAGGITDGFDGLFEKDHSMKADFAKKGSLLSRKNEGFALGLDAFTVQQSHSHVMCCSPSGGGKTTKVIIPSIYNIATSGTGASMVVNDAKLEILPKVKAKLVAEGYTVLKLDFRDPEHSIPFNAFAYAHSPTEINKVCNRLVGEEQGNADPYWRQNGINQIHTTATYLKRHATPQYCNIANIHYILEHLAAEEDTINTMYMQNAEPDLWLRYKTLHANSSRTKASIISSAINYLSHYAMDADICDITSQPDSFDFSRLKSEKIALFIALPIHNQAYYTKLIGLFFDTLFDHLFSEPESQNADSRKVFVIIDELAQIPLPKFEDVISIARSYFAILFVVQSVEQLFERYGQHAGQVILNNCTGIYFTGLRYECKILEELLGNYSYRPDKKNKHVMSQRPLKTAHEIRTMPKDAALIIPNGGLQPIYIPKVLPWYKIKTYVDYVNMIDPDRFAFPMPNSRYRTQYLPLDRYRTNTSGEQQTNESQNENNA